MRSSHKNNPPATDSCFGAAGLPSATQNKGSLQLCMCSNERLAGLAPLHAHAHQTKPLHQSPVMVTGDRQSDDGHTAAAGLMSVQMKQTE